MISENKSKSILIGLICALVLIMGVFNKSYVVSGLFIVVLFAFLYFKRDEEFYDIFYLILLISTTFDYVLYVPGITNMYLFHIVLGLFTLYSLYKVFKDRSIINKLDKKAIVLIGIWFAYICISIFWAENKSLAIKFTAVYILMFSFIFDVIVYNINKNRLRKTVNILIGLISLVVIIGITESLLGVQLPVAHHYDGLNLQNIYSHNALRSRPIAFSFNINNLATTLSLLMPICLFSIPKAKSTISKAFFVVIVSISFAVTILTTSRTGLVATSFGLVVFLIYSICNVKKQGLKMLICPLILVCTFTLSYFQAYRLLNVHSRDTGQRMEVENDIENKMELLKDQEVTIGGDGSINIRMTIIKNVLDDVIQNKNIKGNGVGNVQQFMMEKDNTGGIYNPHCYPAEILCEFGVFGLLLYGVYYLYLLITNLILGIKKKNIWCLAAVGGLVAFAPGCFGPSTITYVFSYWILMAFSISCIQCAKNDSITYWN